MPWLFAVISAVIGYLIGSIMFAIVISRMRGVDLRKHGSGNAGSTNVLRVLGWKWGLITLFCDCAKAALSAFLGWCIGMLAGNPELSFNGVGVSLADFCSYTGALGAVIGHAFPLYFGFKGGKCVACTLGGMMYITPIITLVALVPSLLIIYFTKMVSVGSMVGALLLVALVLIFHWGEIPLMVLIILMWIMVWVSHRMNIKRLIEGKENKIDNIGWEHDSPPDENNIGGEQGSPSGDDIDKKEKEQER